MNSRLIPLDILNLFYNQLTLNPMGQRIDISNREQRRKAIDFLKGFYPNLNVFDFDLIRRAEEFVRNNSSETDGENESKNLTSESFFLKQRSDICSCDFESYICHRNITKEEYLYLCKTIFPQLGSKFFDLICQISQTLIEYKTIEHRLPQSDELFKYLDKAFIAERAPELIDFGENVVVRLSKETMDKLKQCEKVEDNVSDCVLCQDSINTGQKKLVLPCNHSFHCEESECVGNIYEYIRENKKCPLCRYELTENI